MKAALISLGSVSSAWTLEAMKKYFEQVDDINLKSIEVDLGGKKPKVLVDGQPLEDYDCIYLKGSFRYLQILNSVASVLQKNTYVPFAPQAFLMGHDKLLTHLALQQHSVPMPETYISSGPAGAQKLLEKVSYPIVLKFPSGTQGKGVMFADSLTSAKSILDAMSALNQPVIIQKYVETGGTDVRAFVIGDKVVAAMQRKAEEAEKRANIHAGGKGTGIKLDYKTQELAIKTAKAVGASICAVDILKAKGKGSLVIEVNLSPGLQGITEATKIDVADKIGKYLYEQTKKWSGSLDVEGGEPSETIVETLKLNRKRIMLPKTVTDLSGFEEGDEILIKAEKNSVKVSKGKKVK